MYKVEGKADNSVKNLEGICCEICQIDECKDGIHFFANTVRGTVIQTEAEYEGVRIEFQGDLNKAIINMQIDIGFGDVIFPKPQIIPYPTLLDFPAPDLHGYTRESVIAEKLETMVKRGMLNSRMKDFFDIWTLAGQFSFKSTTLVHAIMTTFNHRGTVLTAAPECFSEAFFTDPIKKSQWSAFIRKNHIQHSKLSLIEVISRITHFLAPVLTPNSIIDRTWFPPDKWQ